LKTLSLKLLNKTRERFVTLILLPKNGTLSKKSFAKRAFSASINSIKAIFYKGINMIFEMFP